MKGKRLPKFNVLGKKHSTNEITDNLDLYDEVMNLYQQGQELYELEKAADI